MIDDLADVVAQLGAPKTITRVTSRVLNDEGFEQLGATATLTANMVVWPAPGKDRQQLPEGDRGKNLVAFASDVRLYAVRAPDGGPADRFDHEGTTFEVTRAESWGELGNFWAGIAIEVGQ